MLKKITYCFIALFFAFNFVSCDDYIEKGIEGQWQMTKHKREDGSVASVDTIFYSFKKGVFRYLRLETDVSNFTGYGNYNINENNLSIEIDPNTLFPCDYENCIPKLNWDNQVAKSFVIQKRSSSELELVANNEIFIFKKY